jgi:hypothetical protein
MNSTPCDPYTRRQPLQMMLKTSSIYRISLLNASFKSVPLDHASDLNDYGETVGLQTFSPMSELGPLVEDIAADFSVLQLVAVIKRHLEHSQILHHMRHEFLYIAHRRKWWDP